MLDTAFPRIPGDVGHPDSYPFPVRFEVVAGADVPAIVRPGPPPAALIDAFVVAAQRLTAAGACGLVTSCGFLVHAQNALAEAVRVPVIASALLLGPELTAMTGQRPLGILTADGRALDAAALAAAGLAPSQVAIAGLEGEAAWRRLILETKAAQSTVIDTGEIETIARRATAGLIAASPEIGAILLECGNLPPYAGAIARVSGRPVFSILDAAQRLWSRTQPSTRSPLAKV